MRTSYWLSCSLLASNAKLCYRTSWSSRGSDESCFADVIKVIMERGARIFVRMAARCCVFSEAEGLGVVVKPGHNTFCRKLSQVRVQVPELGSRQPEL